MSAVVNAAFERMTRHIAVEVIGRNYRKDGTLLWNKLNISPVFDVNGVCTHYIAIQTDDLFISKEEVGKLEYRDQTLDLVEYCRNLVEEVQHNLSCQQSLAQPSPHIAFSNQYQSMPCCMDENLIEH
ncbi:MAG: hypothetical protein ICV85_18115, partial [Tolypothrix sp. T3-bin4]|nr:hypothetical protein [Tolypothrix sp. T3-bin4]